MSTTSGPGGGRREDHVRRRGADERVIADASTSPVVVEQARAVLATITRGDTSGGLTNGSIGDAEGIVRSHLAAQALHVGAAR